MEIKVETLSKELVKPASPTPKHLHRYGLSFLDQISPNCYVPLILFYDISTTQFHKKLILNKLQASLSEILTHYYFLAGRIHDNLFVGCADEGVPFFEAEASCQLSDVIQEPFPDEFNKLVPVKEKDDIGGLVLAVQVTFFTCGNFTLGIIISHNIADGVAFAKFVKNWSAIASNNGAFLHPTFESRTLFPPRDMNGYERSLGISKENITLKRFVFGASAIDALRAKYMEQSTLEDTLSRPTRVQTLAAFILGRYMAAAREESGTRKFHVLTIAANLRHRMDPPLSENAFGNIFQNAVLLPSEEENWYPFVTQIREAISNMNEDFVKDLQENGDQFLELMKEGTKNFSEGRFVPFSFSSWCNFGLYDTDFGWGKPVWVAWTSLFTYRNLVVFMDTKYGGGIEAWIHLNKNAMARLEGDKELQTYVSSNLHS